MKPFDLEAAKRGEPVCTRDGRPARIVCWDRAGNPDYPLVILVLNDMGNEEAHLMSENGSFYFNADLSPFDLFMAPKPKRKKMVPECWIHKSKEYAAFSKPEYWIEDWHHIPAHEVEIEE